MRDETAEWITQAEYDIDTAQAMFEAGRYIYCVFMSHLAIEQYPSPIAKKYLENAREVVKCLKQKAN